jgi:hypothetical protein
VYLRVIAVAFRQTCKQTKYDVAPVTCRSPDIAPECDTGVRLFSVWVTAFVASIE